MANPELDAFHALVRKQAGADPEIAIRRASFEYAIATWPVAWGNTLIALIYGDFEPPRTPMHIASLDIVIGCEHNKGTVVHAHTVLTATVGVRDRTVESAHDAIRRLNQLVNALSYVNQGEPVHWWSMLTRRAGGGLFYRLDDNDPTYAIDVLKSLPKEVKGHVMAALYWMRQPREHMIQSFVRSENVAVFAGYWNAFERLVAAINSWLPEEAASDPTSRLAILKTRVEAATGVHEALEAFRETVSPSFRDLATRALQRVVHQAQTDKFIHECFTCTPKSKRLYTIRNEIDHGSLDVDDPETEMVVEARLMELVSIVRNLLHAIITLSIQQRTKAT